MRACARVRVAGGVATTYRPLPRNVINYQARHERHLLAVALPSGKHRVEVRWARGDTGVTRRHSLT